MAQQESYNPEALSDSRMGRREKIMSEETPGPENRSSAISAEGKPTTSLVKPDRFGFLRRIPGFGVKQSTERSSLSQYDPNKHDLRTEGNETVVFDPQTGQEVARMGQITGADLLGRFRGDKGDKENRPKEESLDKRIKKAIEGMNAINAMPANTPAEQAAKQQRMNAARVAYNLLLEEAKRPRSAVQWSRPNESQAAGQGTGGTPAQQQGNAAGEGLTGQGETPPPQPEAEGSQSVQPDAGQQVGSADQEIGQAEVQGDQAEQQQPDLPNAQDATAGSTGNGNGDGGNNGGNGEANGGDGGVEYEGSQEKPPFWWPFTKSDKSDKSEWTKLDEKDRTVQGAVLAMRHYSDMSNAEREANKVKFTAAYKDFSEYALNKKLYDGKDTRIIAVELELERFDEIGAQKYSSGNEERRQQIVVALYRLDHLEREEAGIVQGRRDYKINNQTTLDKRPTHFSEEEWKKYLERPAQIEKELQEVSRTLVGLIGQAFLNDRIRIKTEVQKKVQRLKEEIRKEGTSSIAPVEEWEQKLEMSLLRDTETPFDPNNPYAKEPCEVIIKFIETESAKPDNAQDKTKLEQAERALEWNFHQARSLGILDEVEDRLDRRYQELALSLLSRSRMDVADPEMEQRRSSRNLTFAEVKEVIARESDVDNANSVANTVESDWKFLVREGLSQAQVAHFRGIKRAFVVRAYNQMYDSLSNLHKRHRVETLRRRLNEQLVSEAITPEQYAERIADIPIPTDRPIQRISGEWNVRGQERLIERSLDAEERAEQGSLHYSDRGYYITLTGTTTDLVERGVDNYLKSLLEGAHIYDVQTILSKLQYLSAAIFATKDQLLRNGVPEAEADRALTRIAIFAENRGDFYVMDYAAQNLLMDDVFIPLYDKWGGTVGIEKLKRTLDMNNGLVAPAMLLFLSKKNELLWQPAGFKGQGMNNIWAQRTLRVKIKEQIAEELVNYQAAPTTPTTATELMEQTNWQDFLRKKFTDNLTEVTYEDGSKVKLTPKGLVAIYKKDYEEELARVKWVDKAATAKDLESLRRTREAYIRKQNEYDRLLANAKSAVETTMQIFNIFGETAYLGAPSIIMDHGDQISIEDVTYFYKFAIMDAMKKTGDTPAKMRWRGYQWTKGPWQYADGEQRRPVLKRKIAGREVAFELVKGLEDIGITPEEYKAFMDAVKNLRTNGYMAKFTSSSEKDESGKLVEYTFEEIVKRNDVKPVRNNYIGNYKSSRDIFINPTALREAKKGGQPFIMRILERLDISGRGKFTDLDRAKIDEKPIDDVAPERLKEIFEDAVTDSFSFHILVRQLARWEASRKSSSDGRGNITYAKGFSTDRLYYGGNEFPWGVKRLQYLTEYWMTNKRERVGRAWELLPFTALLKSGLAQECDAENLPDLIFTVNKEHIDEPGLRQAAAGYKDAQGWRQRGETSVDEQRGETNWSFWDKPTVDIAQALKHFPPKFPQKDKNSMDTWTVYDYIQAPDPAEFMDKYPLLPATKKELVDVTREVLKRVSPINVFLEAQLGYNRSAGGSGMGLEFGERMNYRYFLWLLSQEDEGDRQEKGGLVVNEDAKVFLQFVSIKNSWSKSKNNSASIFDEAWRQARGTRDAGASDKFPNEVIT